MLTIFRKQPDSDLYERIEEAHYQRAYSVERKKLLAEGGLSMVECFDASMEGGPTENSERIYVVAKTKEV